MMKKLYGVDFGTSAIKLYNSSNHILLHEKNVIAIHKDGTIVGFGNEAYEMFEKAPEEVKVSFPIQSGVIAEIKAMEQLFHCFFQKLIRNRFHLGADFVLAISPSITEVEKRAFFDLVSDAKVAARQIYIVEQPIADAIGCGININSAKGNMIVNIGADNTELTILSMGGIVLNRQIKTGGNKIDEAIVSAIRRKYNLLIGRKTAEMLKIELGDLSEERSGEMVVFGRNVITGLPAKKTIPTELVYQAITATLEDIMEAIRIMIERTPPELAADIMDTGIHLTGGTAAIANLGEYLERGTGLKVYVEQEPSESVIHGIAAIIATPELKHLKYIPREKDY